MSAANSPSGGVFTMDQIRTVRKQYLLPSQEATSVNPTCGQLLSQAKLVPQEYAHGDPCSKR